MEPGGVAATRSSNRASVSTPSSRARATSAAPNSRLNHSIIQ